MSKTMTLLFVVMLSFGIFLIPSAAQATPQCVGPNCGPFLSYCFATCFLTFAENQGPCLVGGEEKTQWALGCAQCGGLFCWL